MQRLIFKFFIEQIKKNQEKFLTPTAKKADTNPNNDPPTPQTDETNISGNDDIDRPSHWLNNPPP